MTVEITENKVNLPCFVTDKFSTTKLRVLVKLMGYILKLAQFSGKKMASIFNQEFYFIF